MIRFFDIIFSLFALTVGVPVFALLLLLGWLDTGSPLFRQERVGRFQKPFTLLKFRSMLPNTISVATHLADASAVTNLGQFLRRTKLDELPQILNVLKGEMSLVGPRPCLFNQTDLIAERESRGVFNVRPGITGLAQIKGTDMSTPKLLAETDECMLRRLSVPCYFYFLFKTVIGSGVGDHIKTNKIK